MQTTDNQGEITVNPRGTPNHPRYIYTDGAAPNNQTECLRGGIGVAILDEAGEVLSTYAAPVLEQTTNNQCELLALIKGLELAEAGDTIYTDSTYAANGCNKWLSDWKAKGWKTARKKPVQNKELWVSVDELLRAKPDVTIKWVKAHNGNKGNELADSLASGEALGF